MNISQRTVQGVCVLDIDGPITLGADGSEKLGDKVRSVLQTGRSRSCQPRAPWRTSTAPVSGSWSTPSRR